MVLASDFTKITSIDDVDDDYIPIIQDQSGTPVNRIISVSDFGGGFTIVMKTVDEVIQSDITLSDDADLFFPVDVNSRYAIFAFIKFKSESNADLRQKWTAPSGTVAERSSSFNPTAGGSAQDMLAQGSVNGFGSLATLNTMGFILTGGSAGNFNYQWAQQTSQASDTTIFEGSWIAFRKA